LIPCTLDEIKSGESTSCAPRKVDEARERRTRRRRTCSGAKRDLIVCQLCAGTEVRLGMAFGGRGVKLWGSNCKPAPPPPLPPLPLLSLSLLLPPPPRCANAVHDPRARRHMQRARTKRSRKKALVGTHLVEGHLLRYASGLATASGTSLPHRSDKRISSQEAAGLVVPAAAVVVAAAVTADLTGYPEGMVLLQEWATTHRDRGWHS